MKRTLLMFTLALAVSAIAIARAQDQPAPQESEAQPAPIGLSDLDKLTFACPKAALNAAARRAREVPSQGAYQFTYFNIISNSHHALYEVHFKSN